MLKFLQWIFLVGIISGCTSQDMNIKYEYPKNKDQREIERIGFLKSEPIYLVKPQENKQ